MVLFFESSAIQPHIEIYMGKDKIENEELIKHGFDNDVWFHVDKLSSAHVYMRLRDDMSWDNIPHPALYDCSQLVKANSIQGNKKDNVIIIYTPWSNLKKTGDMEDGAVAFHNDRLVKRVHVPTRENAIVNRINKSKTEREVDFIAEKIERERKLGQMKKKDAIVRKQATDQAKKEMQDEKAARSYDKMWSAEDEEEAAATQPRGMEMEDDFM
ncbi:Coiled-coil domain-containing protein 25 [Wallemia ichthyophaga EXF-994]|uniref:Coiled-coil domain-containing protein 25 n=1 Tax=Wallemia ichthyophaga (strain EXF-994 / CBS 113033) TaxID=1299270 RepID=R9AV07_WALI9|nr:Coiled-coil domain-containing protein 25 [Wallemia ichthyophaga EXF-994]EOR03931.1 Coiled-coil domain-containing protein 25 [Wallemia ichthyophaga EXF-994]